MNVRISPSVLKGTLTVQPSKSDAHRRLICAAFAKGTSQVDNVVLSLDIKATIRCITEAGAGISIEDSMEYPGRKKIKIKGTDGFAWSPRHIDCGESGSVLRFMIMVFATMGGHTVFTGGGRLPERPIDGAIGFLEDHGFECKYPGDGIYLPFDSKGTLHGDEYTIDSSVTSQYITGLMMGLASTGKGGSVTASGKYESKGYVEITREVIRCFGVEIAGDNPYIIPPGSGLTSCRSSVEGDWSNGSYHILMKALGADIDVAGLDDESVQPDSAIIKHIDSIRQQECPLIDISECPDIMPTLAVYAATLDKTTVITGGRRLRTKESDRIKAVAAGLKSIGTAYEEKEDGIVIHGGVIRGGTVDGMNDHRIAMAFSALCTVAAEDIIIKGAECVNKTYPDFFDDLRRLGGLVE